MPSPCTQGGKLTIEWARDGERLRKVVRRSNLRVTGKFPSIRNRASVHWESFIERDCFKRLDADPTVTKFAEQAAKFIYFDGGVQRYHFPDVFFVYRGRQGFLEIKADQDPGLGEAKARASLLTPLLSNLGYSYRIVTDLEIRARPRFDNAQTLLRLGREKVDVRDREAIRIYFQSNGQTTWHAVLAGCLGQFGPRKVARLILDGLLSFDTSRLLGADTVIFSSHQSCSSGDPLWQ